MSWALKLIKVFSPQKGINWVSLMDCGELIGYIRPVYEATNFQHSRDFFQATLWDCFQSSIWKTWFVWFVRFKRNRPESRWMLKVTFCHTKHVLSWHKGSQYDKVGVASRSCVQLLLNKTVIYTPLMQSQSPASTRSSHIGHSSPATWRSRRDVVQSSMSSSSSSSERVSADLTDLRTPRSGQPRRRGEERH